MLEVTDDSNATVTELLYYLDKLQKNKQLNYAIEWQFAYFAEWKNEEFLKLYKEYIASTQLKIKKGESATSKKGDPLEKISRYFLEKGGISSSVKSLASPGKWQIDGQGRLNKTAMKSIFGNELCDDIGFQLYLECKNHIVPVSGDEFSSFFRKMSEHHCNFGILFSTSGYKIQKGLGIAESIQKQYWKKCFILIFTLKCFMDIIDKNIPPLALLSEAMDNIVNDKILVDVPLQKKFSAAFCHKLAKEEFLNISQKKFRGHDT